MTQPHDLDARALKARLDVAMAALQWIVDSEQPRVRLKGWAASTLRVLGRSIGAPDQLVNEAGELSGT